MSVAAPVAPTVEVGNHHDVMVEDCWACGEPCDVERSCPGCDAPPWPFGGGTGGVYILRATCGLVKIGFSGNIDQRTAGLVSQARRHGHGVEVICELRGAGRNVERFLHDRFCETRDYGEARDLGLPAPTEWFWPTPALRRLVDGGEFIRGDERWREVFE